MEQLLDLQPGTRNGGTYDNKPGYHNTRDGNLSSDYSVTDAEDKGGPSDKTAAYDWTFPDAQGFAGIADPHSTEPMPPSTLAVDYGNIARYSSRLLASGKDPNDPRLDGWREFFGQADNDNAVEGWDFRYHRAKTSDPRHLWHIHLSEDRDKVTSYDNKKALLSVLRGETVDQWRNVRSEDIPISGDWNRDGIDTIGVFRPSTSTFYLRDVNSGDATRIFKFGHGPSGDIPVAGDWNKDGYDTVGVFRPSNSTWYLTNGTTSLDKEFKFGHGPSGDLPVAGDWNKDSIDTVGVFRPGNSTWYLTDNAGSLDHDFVFGHGPSGDQAVAGDWNKDGIDTVGVFRPANSTWYLTNNAGSLDFNFIFGHGPSRDVAVPGDWNNDGIDTPGVRRPGNNMVYLRNANSGGAVDEDFIYGI